MSISSEDAKRDNIRVTLEGNEFRKYTAYHIICESCGREYVKRRYNSNDEHLCEKCRYMRNKKIKAKEQIDLGDTRTRNELKFEKAIEEMKKQVAADAQRLAELEKALEDPEMNQASKLTALAKKYILEKKNEKTVYLRVRDRGTSR